MKKVLFVALQVAILAITAVAAQADQVRGALVIKDEGCLMLDGVGGLVWADRDQAVVTSSGNGLIICMVQGVTPPPDGRVMVFNYENTGIECGHDFTGSTTRWENRITPSGVAFLSCHFNRGR